MTVAHLSHLLSFLEQLGVHPKKSLSQNFLVDPNIVRKICCLADIKEGELVVEIGPGPGALTSELLKRGAIVTAIEKDTVFAKELNRLQNGALTVIEADILTLDWSLLGKGPWKVIGNLPYHITTPIIEIICQKPVTTFTFMVQKELAERLMALPGSKECGSISVFVQSHASIKGSFFVPRTCFYPSPQVDSTVLTLQFHTQRDPESLFTLVRTAFQQRRKMLTSSLKKIFPQGNIRDALQSAGVSLTARPETLTLSQWRMFYEGITKSEPLLDSKGESSLKRLFSQ